MDERVAQCFSLYSWLFWTMVQGMQSNLLQDAERDEAEEDDHEMDYEEDDVEEADGDLEEVEGDLEEVENDLRDSSGDLGRPWAAFVRFGSPRFAPELRKEFQKQFVKKHEGFFLLFVLSLFYDDISSAFTRKELVFKQVH